MAGLRPAPYQLVALSKLIRGQTGGLLIADGVGVGKTISAGYIVDWVSRRLRENVMIVCPPGLIEKWRLEMRQKFEIQASPIRSLEELVTARAESRQASRGFVYLLPSSRLDLPLELDFRAIIVDEIHNLRNRETKSWRFARKMMATAGWRVGLSATPVNNSVADLANILSLLLPTFDPLAVEATTEDLWTSREYSLLTPLLTRFTKEALGLQFSRRKVQTVSVRYPPSYAEQVRGVVQSLVKKNVQDGRYPLESITYFREAASSPRSFEKSTGAKLGMIEDPKLSALDKVLRGLSRQVLVFCQFTETVAYLESALVDFVIYTMTGDVPVDDREAIIDAFRKRDKAVLLLTQVGSEGLDLQFCDAVVNYDLHWNPMILEQRVGRIDRIGQTKPEITVYDFFVEGSIDARVLAVVGRKLRQLIGSPLETAAPEAAEQPLWDARSIRAEEDSARQTLESLDLSAKLPESDSLILSTISPIACDPEKLVQMEPLSWLNGATSTSKQWLTEQFSAEREIVTRLSRYQNVVQTRGARA
jgi:SNF2 family DNA or RNA helicase